LKGLFYDSNLSWTLLIHDIKIKKYNSGNLIKDHSTLVSP